MTGFLAWLRSCFLLRALGVTSGILALSLISTDRQCLCSHIVVCQLHTGTKLKYMAARDLSYRMLFECYCIRT